MDDGGSRSGVSLSDRAQWRGPAGRFPLVETLEDT